MFAGWQLVHLCKPRKNCQYKLSKATWTSTCYQIPAFKTNLPTQLISSSGISINRWKCITLRSFLLVIFEINFRHHPLLPIKMLNTTRSNVDKAWRVSRPCHAQLTRLTVDQTTGWQVSTVFTHGERTESLRARVGVPPFEAVRGLLAPACSSKTQPNPPDPPFPSLYLSSEETTRRYVRKCRASKRLRSYS